MDIDPRGWMSAVGPWLATAVGRSVLLIVVVSVGRWIAARALDGAWASSPSEVRRRIQVTLRNVALVVSVAGLVLVWAQELQSLLLSIVAFAAALAIALKEVLTCLAGTLVQTTTRSFEIGDRIEVAQHRGDVIDHNLMTTTLLEVGPGQQTHQYTGRAVVLPNSLFITGVLVNESFTEDYLLHTFLVAIPRTEDWKAAEAALLTAANAEVADYLPLARAFLEKQSRRRHLEIVSVEPRVHLRLSDPGRYELLTRIVVPARQRGRVEQAILRRYLSAVAAG